MRIVAISYLFIAVGGALGAMARFALNVLLQRDVAFPWGTLSTNLLGCLVMGVVAQLVASSVWFNESGLVPDQYRLLLHRHRDDARVNAPGERLVVTVAT